MNRQILLRFKRFISNTLPLAVLLLGLTTEIKAIPQFAKKYKVSCNTCHVAVPKLNAFGEKFRMNSFQLPGSIESTPVWQEDVLPLSGMPHTMFMSRNVENNMAVKTPNGIPSGDVLQVNTFQAAFEIFSGGIVGPHLSYLAFMEIESEPEVSMEGGEPEAGGGHKVLVGASEDEPVASIGTETSVVFHQLFITYNNLLNFWGENIGNLNLKMGIFHLETPFNSLRKLTGHSSPYLVYSVRPVDGGFSLANRQLGLSANGWMGSMRLGIEYELAVLNGTNNKIDTNIAKDFYGRLAVNWREKIRIGLLAYRGWQNIGGGSNLAVEDDFFYRLGLDASLKLPNGVDIFGQWIRGYDDDIDAEISGMQPFKFDGVFVETDIPLKGFVSSQSFLRKLMLVAKVDLVRVSKQLELPHEEDNTMLVKNTGNVNQILLTTVALRHYFMPNVFLVIEGGFQDNMIGYPEVDEMFETGTGKAGRVVDVDANWLMAMLVVAF